MTSFDQSLARFREERAFDLMLAADDHRRALVQQGDVTRTAGERAAAAAESVADSVACMAAVADWSLPSIIEQLSLNAERMLGLNEMLANPMATKAAEFYRRGLHALNSGWWSEARTEFGRSIEEYPYDPWSWFHLGIACQRDLSSEAAAEAFGRCARYGSQVEPGLASAAALTSAGLLRLAGRQEASRDVLREYADTLGQCVELHLACAVHDGSVAHLTRALLLSPAVAYDASGVSPDMLHKAAVAACLATSGPVARLRDVEGMLEQVEAFARDVVPEVAFERPSARMPAHGVEALVMAHHGIELVIAHADRLVASLVQDRATAEKEARVAEREAFTAQREQAQADAEETGIKQRARELANVISGGRMPAVPSKQDVRARIEATRPAREQQERQQAQQRAEMDAYQAKQDSLNSAVRTAQDRFDRLRAARDEQAAVVQRLGSDPILGYCPDWFEGSKFPAPELGAGDSMEKQEVARARAIRDDAQKCLDDSQSRAAWDATPSRLETRRRLDADIQLASDELDQARASMIVPGGFPGRRRKRLEKAELALQRLEAELAEAVRLRPEDATRRFVPVEEAQHWLRVASLRLAHAEARVELMEFGPRLEEAGKALRAAEEAHRAGPGLAPARLVLGTAAQSESMIVRNLMDEYAEQYARSAAALQEAWAQLAALSRQVNGPGDPRTDAVDAAIAGTNDQFAKVTFARQEVERLIEAPLASQRTPRGVAEDTGQRAQAAAERIEALEVANNRAADLLESMRRSAAESPPRIHPFRGLLQGVT